MSDPNRVSLSDQPDAEDLEMAIQLQAYLYSEEAATRQPDPHHSNAGHGIPATDSNQQLQTQPNIHHPHAGHAGNQFQQTPAQMNFFDPGNGAGTLPYQEPASFSAQPQTSGQPSGFGNQGTQQQQRFGPHGQVFVRRGEQPVGSNGQQLMFPQPSYAYREDRSAQHPPWHNGGEPSQPRVQQPSYRYIEDLSMQQPSSHMGRENMYPDLSSDPEYPANDEDEQQSDEDTGKGKGKATQRQPRRNPSRRGTGTGPRVSERPTAEGVLNGQGYIAPRSNSPLERFPENHPIPSTAVVLKDLADRWYSGCNHFAHYGDEQEGLTKYSQQLRYPIKLARGRRPQKSEVSTGFGPDHPEPTETLPARLSLLELMNNYPNHCWGEGLRLLMAEGVTAEELYNNIPEALRHTAATLRPHNYLQHAYSRELSRMLTEEAGVKRQPAKRGQSMSNDDDQGEPSTKKQKISSETRSPELSTAATGFPSAPPTDDPFGAPLLGQTGIPSVAPTDVPSVVHQHGPFGVPQHGPFGVPQHGPFGVPQHGPFGVQGQPQGIMQYLRRITFSQRAHLFLERDHDNLVILRARWVHQKDLWKELSRQYLDLVDAAFSGASPDERVSLLEWAFEYLCSLYTRDLRDTQGLQETGDAAMDDNVFYWLKLILLRRNQDHQAAGETFEEYDDRLSRRVLNEMLQWIVDVQVVVSEHLQRLRQQRYIHTALGTAPPAQDQAHAPDDDQNEDQNQGGEPMDTDQ